MGYRLGPASLDSPIAGSSWVPPPPPLLYGAGFAWSLWINKPQVRDQVKLFLTHPLGELGRGAQPLWVSVSSSVKLGDNSPP